MQGEATSGKTRWCRKADEDCKARAAQDCHDCMDGRTAWTSSGALQELYEEGHLYGTFLSALTLDGPVFLSYAWIDEAHEEVRIMVARGRAEGGKFFAQHADGRVPGPVRTLRTKDTIEQY